jgi:ferrous iron transport protein B
LAGNPNVGKSTIFNALVGEHQHTGNWPGKTVEKAEGTFSHEGREIVVVDLPGAYSLSAHSPEEIIARDFILGEAPDVVIDVLDATLLERNLNLALQLLELGDRVVLALNFMDELEKAGLRVDVSALEQELGVPVIPIVARDRRGLDELVERAVAVAEGKEKTHPIRIDYGIALERAMHRIQKELDLAGVTGRPRWIALKLLEDDPDIGSAFRSGDLSRYAISGRDSGAKLAAVFEIAQHLGEEMSPDSGIEIVRRRYEAAHRIVHKAAANPHLGKIGLTDKLDRIVTHRFWAWPTMFAVLLAIFWMTIEGASLPSDLLASGVTMLAHGTRTWLTGLDAPWWITGSLVDGLLFGVGTVVSVMLPPMVIFFVLFALMEDFGLIPRVAFNLDRVMQALGSQGKQCLTCMMSYGCNVVGVTSTRIIDNEKDRLVSILTSPLIICNGRFGPGIALAILFFGEYAAPVMLSLLLLSLSTYFCATFVLNKTIFRGERAGFMLELPPYRRPQIRRVIWRALVDRVTHVMLRAIEIAAPAALVIWIMGNVPPGQPYEKTVIGLLANSLAPLGHVWGLDGQMIAALLFSLPAKEIVIPSLAMTYGLQTSLMESEGILTFLTGQWSILSAYTFLVLYMLFLPCLVTVWAVWKETRSAKWTMLGIVVSFVTAALSTTLAYAVGSALGF